jgi:hypothetical protein
MLPRIANDLEQNDAIYALINEYDRTFKEKF